MPSLFDPLPLRSGLTVRNRVFQAPMSIWMSDGMFPSQRMADFYAERARGGVGLIVTQPLPVHPTSLYHPWVPGYDPAVVPGLRRIADAVHEHGALLFAQLIHNGHQMNGNRSQLPVWGVSAIASPLFTETPHAMTTAEVREIVEAFAASAALVREAGFDGVELHAAHGYLFQQFFLEAFNHRSDEYGGSFENRVRFLEDVCRAIHARCGPGFGLGVQINSSEGLSWATNPELAGRITARVDALAIVDYLSITQGSHPQGDPSVSQCPDMSFPHAPYLEWAIAIRRHARELPVGFMGRIREPDRADAMIRQEQVDFVSLGRPLLTDPFWVRKAQAGAHRDIRPCIGVNQDCRQAAAYIAPGCIHNPIIGREGRYGEGRIQPAARSLRLAVIGGGPAGLEAAAWAQRRGHRVTLFEADEELGGQARFGGLPPHRTGFQELVDYQLRQVERWGVDVRLGLRIDQDARSQLDGFDVVVVATGSRAVAPSLPGDGSVPVFDLTAAVRAPHALGPQVAILDRPASAWEVGALAQFLAYRGQTVHALAHGSVFCPEVPGPDASRFRQLNADLGIAVRTGVGFVRLEDGHLVAAQGDRQLRLAVSAVVVDAGRVADDALLRVLQTWHPRILAAGDCVAPRRASQAIREGFLAVVDL